MTEVPAEHMVTNTLSSREVQVLEMAARGLRNAEIAVQLGLSVHAIKFHLAAVYRKLGVNSRVDAVVMYLRSAPSDSPQQV